MNNIECDVAIIGAGPAGSVAGALLAKAGWRVVLLEKEAFPRFRIGESLLPSGNSVLKRIGVWDRMDAAGFIRKYEAEFITPDREHTVRNSFAENTFTEGNPYAYEVERSKFDSLLLENAQASGCEVRHSTTVRNVTAAEDSWLLKVQSANQEESVRARWVIDASGRDALLAKELKIPRLPLPYPKRIAVYNHFDGIPLQDGQRAGNIIITRLPGGWSWSIPLADGKVSVGVVTSLSEFQQAKLEPENYFYKVCAQSSFLTSHTDTATPLDKFRVTADYSYINSTFAGNRYLLVGDAAGFIDPIFSSGVCLAMQSAELAADTMLKAGLNGHLSASTQKAFTRKMRARMKIMQDLVEAFYDEDGMAVFMSPTNRFDLFKAVGHVVAGNTELPFHIWVRFMIFKLICRFNKSWHFIPSKITPRHQSIAPGKNLSMTVPNQSK